MHSKALTTLALLTIAGLSLATGCVTEREPRRNLEPTWSYQDTPDPMAYSEVWDRPATLTDAQVAQMRDEMQR